VLEGHSQIDCGGGLAYASFTGSYTNNVLNLREFVQYRSFSGLRKLNTTPSEELGIIFD
jgi:hypothetical protein